MTNSELSTQLSKASIEDLNRHIEDLWNEIGVLNQANEKTKELLDAIQKAHLRETKRIITLEENTIDIEQWENHLKLDYETRQVFSDEIKELFQSRDNITEHLKELTVWAKIRPSDI